MDSMRRADPCVGAIGLEIIEPESHWEFLKTMLQDCDEFQNETEEQLRTVNRYERDVRGFRKELQGVDAGLHLHLTE